ncbi:MAG: hypothetical protein J5509_02905 [Lachnospiraceae bacterium]|nr:hypothetical protein [Lachnospiraceae bacterium]
MDFKKKIEKNIQSRENNLNATLSKTFGQDEHYKEHEAGAPMALERDFIQKEVSAQESFRKMYPTDAEGIEYQPVQAPETYHAQEVAVQSRNIKYFQGKTRKQSVQSAKTAWLEVMNKTYAGELDEKYSYTLDKDKVSETTGEMMLSTVRLMEIEKKKLELKNEFLNKDNLDKISPEKAQLIRDYEEVIMALGPTIVADMDNNATVKSKVGLRKDSVEAYRAYLRQVLEDPVTAVQNAVQDAMHNIMHLSENTFGADSITVRYDKIMQMRDRYDAIVKLHSSRYDPDNPPSDADALRTMISRMDPRVNIAKDKKKKENEKDSEEKKDQEHHAPDEVEHRHYHTDSFKFFSNMTQMLNADITACLAKAKMSVDPGRLSYKGKAASPADTLKSDGNLSLKGLRALKNNTLRLNKANNNRNLKENRLYWEEREEAVYSALEDKLRTEEEKKKIEEDGKEVKDRYNIRNAANELKAQAVKNGKAVEYKAFVDLLILKNRQMSQAIEDVDRKIELAEAALKTDEVISSPQLKDIMSDDLKRYRYQKAVLLDRAAGYINALDHVVNGAELTGMGESIMDTVTNALVDKAIEEEKQKKEQGGKDEEEDDFVVDKASLRMAERSRLASSTTLLKRLNNIADEGNAPAEKMSVDEGREELLTLAKEAEDIVNYLKDDRNDVSDRVIDRMAAYRSRAVTLFRQMKDSGKTAGLKKEIRNSLTGDAQARFDTLMNEFSVKNDCIDAFLTKYRADSLKKRIDSGKDISGVRLTPAEQLELKKLYGKTDAASLGKYLDKKLPSYRMRLERASDKVLAPQKLGLMGERNKQTDARSLEQLLLTEDQIKERNLKIEENKKKAEIERLKQIKDNEEAVKKQLEEEQRKLEELENKRKEREEQRKKQREEEEKARKEREELNKKNREEREKQDRERAERERQERERQENEIKQRQAAVLKQKKDKFDKLPNNKTNVWMRMLELNSLNITKEFEDTFGKVSENDDLAEYKKEFIRNYQDKLSRNMRTYARDCAKVRYGKGNPSEAEIRSFVPKELAPVEQGDIDYLEQYRQKFNVENPDYRKIDSERADADDHRQISKLMSFRLAALVDAIKDTEAIFALREKLGAEDEANKQLAEEKIEYNTNGYDVRQTERNSCWACSGIFMSNHYIDRHQDVAKNNFRFDKTKKKEFLSQKNAVLNKEVEQYMKTDPAVQKTVDDETADVKQFLTGKVQGNSYVMADVFLKNMSNTAVRHTTFTFDMDSAVMKDEATRTLIGNALLARINKELKACGGPISLFRPGHYLTITGMQGNMVIVHSSTEGVLDQDIPMTAEDLMNYGSIELVGLQHLDENSINELDREYDIKGEAERIYDENGNLVADPRYQNENERKEALMENDNFYHNLGKTFKKTDEKVGPLAGMERQRIYMPKNLDAVKNVDDNMPDPAKEARKKKEAEQAKKKAELKKQQEELKNRRAKATEVHEKIMQAKTEKDFKKALEEDGGFVFVESEKKKGPFDDYEEVVKNDLQSKVATYNQALQKLPKKTQTAEAKKQPAALDVLNADYAAKEEQFKNEGKTAEDKGFWLIGANDSKTIGAVLADEKSQFASKMSETKETKLKDRNTALGYAKKGNMIGYEVLPAFLKEYYGKAALDDFFKDDNSYKQGKLPDISYDLKSQERKDFRKKVADMKNNAAFVGGIRILYARVTALKRKARNDKKRAAELEAIRLNLHSYLSVMGLEK